LLAELEVKQIAVRVSPLPVLPTRASRRRLLDTELQGCSGGERLRRASLERYFEFGGGINVDRDRSARRRILKDGEDGEVGKEGGSEDDRRGGRESEEVSLRFEDTGAAVLLEQDHPARLQHLSGEKIQEMHANACFLLRRCRGNGLTAGWGSRDFRRECDSFRLRLRRRA
jgi:hypothetical protein